MADTGHLTAVTLLILDWVVEHLYSSMALRPEPLYAFMPMLSVVLYASSKICAAMIASVLSP